MRHENYLKPVRFGNDVLRFYMDVAAWEQEPEMEEKLLLFPDLIVTAFRLEARTSAFLRKRMRDDGTVRYGLGRSRGVSPTLPYVEKPYQPYELVWILFKDILEPKYNQLEKKGKVLVIDLLGDTVDLKGKALKIDPEREEKFEKQLFLQRGEGELVKCWLAC